MSKKVLVVEDDPRSLKLVRDLVEALGYQALEAMNGLDGVIMAEEQHPDLIFMDIQMPVMDGLEAIKRIRALPSNNSIPIIVLTAYSLPTEESEIRASGCNDLMTKPIDTRRLVALLHEYLGAA
ncbi:response regulator [Pseudodesulfovibrio piezophilus]|uniref:Polar-differentiation response regulator divK n=1 Tax=Pseudodesulfovibrio piezophilus (strain DSM 21447 / JCM 15486 / C1TLV30) TaxID=1322246 RepID=M1WK32_PSEP2|nr:response regulator [Pseudodesulfovibrio piezophilus]CCH48896.1 Polar-differentiation response regulator divK [Pseudodesulfovibrio piezophilus C1TLV30]